MNDGPTAIKPSHIAAAKLKVAIADREGNKLPNWIVELAARNLTDLRPLRPSSKSDSDWARSTSQQSEPKPEPGRLGHVAGRAAVAAGDGPVRAAGPEPGGASRRVAGRAAVPPPVNRGRSRAAGPEPGGAWRRVAGGKSR